MITLQLNGNGLVGTRFVFSPMWELVCAYRLLKMPNRHSYYHDWVEDVQGKLQTMDVAYLEALISGMGYVADFLTPHWETHQPTIDEELARICDTPNDMLQRHVGLTFVTPEEVKSEPNELTLPDVLNIIQNRAIPDVAHGFFDEPQRALGELVEQLYQFWHMAIEPQWGRIKEIAEGDILYRSRQMMLEGADVMLNNLHPHLRYEDRKLVVLKDCIDRNFEGNELVLVPLYFSYPDFYMLFAPEWEPTITYTPRGVAELSKPADAHEAMELTLGGTKSQILLNLVAPCNTGELAKKLHLTAGAVSQHLGRLSEAGLVEATQIGKRVFYRLTQRGSQLLKVFEAGS